MIPTDYSSLERRMDQHMAKLRSEFTVDVATLRDDLMERVSALRQQSVWAAKHNFKMEAIMHDELVAALEPVLFKIEAMLVKAGVRKENKTQ